MPSNAAFAHAPCPICQEKFEPKWLVEANDFVWMDAMQVGAKVYHASCWTEYIKGLKQDMPAGDAFSALDAVSGKRKADEDTATGLAKKIKAQ